MSEFANEHWNHSLQRPLVLIVHYLRKPARKGCCLPRDCNGFAHIFEVDMRRSLHPLWDGCTQGAEVHMAAQPNCTLSYRDQAER